MLNMYPSKNTNIIIAFASVAVFAASLWLVRSQQTVDDVSYMRAMISHHSIAILTSGRSHIRDPRVRELAEGIIAAQVKEIGEIKQLIADLAQRPISANAPDIPARGAE